MAVRIGSVELRAIEDLRMNEQRNLQEQSVPGQSGSVFQDLGRAPTGISLRGSILGEGAFEDLETLRQAHASSEPQSFAADIAVGSELTDVIVRDFRVAQVPGHVDRYRFSLELSEYTEPPEPEGFGLPEVDLGILGDAANWADLATAVGGVLNDPSSFLDVLSENAGLLDELDLGELGAAIADAVEDLTGADLSGVLSALSEIDPQKALEVIQAIQDADSLGDFLEKYVDEGLDLLEDLTGVDLDAVGALVTAFTEGGDFLSDLKRVADAAQALVDDLGQFNPLAGLPGAGT